jgi:hypothetical protein
MTRCLVMEGTNVVRTTLTLGEAARHAEVSPETMRRWCDSGKVAHERTASGGRLIEAASLQQYLGTRAKAASSPQEPRS